MTDNNLFKRLYARKIKQGFDPEQASDYANSILILRNNRDITCMGLNYSQDDDGITPDNVRNAIAMGEQQFAALEELTYGFSDGWTAKRKEYQARFYPGLPHDEAFLLFLQDTRKGTYSRQARTKVYLAARFSLDTILGGQYYNLKEIVANLEQGLCEQQKMLLDLEMLWTTARIYSRRHRIQCIKRAWQGVPGFEMYRNWFAPIRD